MLSCLTGLAATLAAKAGARVTQHIQYFLHLYSMRSQSPWTSPVSGLSFDEASRRIRKSKAKLTEFARYDTTGW
ncbi:exported hypothetical protein [Cupriavidus taiwanensis]|nr:exported hypothetical protein [Cupriavidus taiwanensis]